MPFALAGAGVSAIGSIFGGGKEGDAAKNASNAEVNAANNAIATQQNEFNSVRQYEAPYASAGSTAVNDIMGEMPDLTATFNPTQHGVASTFNYDPSQVANDPAYQFALSQGTQALQRSAAASGNVLGAGTQKSLAQYAEGTASQFENQDYNQALQSYNTNYSDAFNTFTQNRDQTFNKLLSFTGLGTTANSQIIDAGKNFANQTSEFQTQVGNAQASGILGKANAQASEWGGVSAGMTNLANKSFNSFSLTPSSSSYDGSGEFRAPSSTPDWSSYDKTAL